ncbi:hypothetical protein M5689_015158 [Euphorbia peplus]|nr:hypothetical protein M5689_015158 [Euphorbia peplus]
MSAIIDIWTQELAKLREQGQTLWSSGSNHESNNVAQAEASSSMLPKSLGSLVHSMKVKSTSTLSCSEASLSIINDYFSA